MLGERPIRPQAAVGLVSRQRIIQQPASLLALAPPEMVRRLAQPTRPRVPLHQALVGCQFLIRLAVPPVGQPKSERALQVERGAGPGVVPQ